MLSTIQGEQGHLSAVIYTQITDVELEVCAVIAAASSLNHSLQCDGFLNFDRRCVRLQAQCRLMLTHMQQQVQQRDDDADLPGQPEPHRHHERPQVTVTLFWRSTFHIHPTWAGHGRSGCEVAGRGADVRVGGAGQHCAVCRWCVQDAFKFIFYL